MKGGGNDKKSRNRFRTSKHLSKILRHEAESLGIHVMEDGYVLVEEMLEKSTLKISLEDLKEIEENCSKKRFDLKTVEGKVYIRANQGHSMKTVQSNKLLERIRLEDLKNVPMAVHGTLMENWVKIKASGYLSRMSRNHIHFAMSDDRSKVLSGFRASSQVLIYLNLEKALKHGIIFYKSKNGVLLSEGLNGSGNIPLEYIERVLDESSNIILT